LNSRAEGVIPKALELLKVYPLCDRCLGRLFAHYGVGLSNVTRGRALKTLLAMEIYRRISAGELEVIDDLKLIAPNAGYPLNKLYEKFVGKLQQVRKCAVCGGRLEILIGKLVSDALSRLEGVDSRTFVVGVKAGSKIEFRETKIAEEFSLTSWESVRREVKREVGKKIQGLRAMLPDFKEPDIVIIVDLDNESVDLKIMPLYLGGTYLKIGRFIPQGGGRGISLVNVIGKGLLKMLRGGNLKMLTPFIEPSDIRLLGGGGPIIVKVVEPRTRYVDLAELSKVASYEPWVLVSFNEAHNTFKVYWREPRIQRVSRALVYVSEGISDDDVRSIEKSFTNMEVKQVLLRRLPNKRYKEITRSGMVYEVRGRKLTANTGEFLIRCSKSVLIRGLITGENKSSPSFSSVIYKEVKVLFLDVLGYTI